MSKERQYGSGETEDAVLNRLRLLERVFDPATTRHLETIGVGEGWKCLEVGAGAGSVAQWLSERTGPGGRVVATDINTEYLQQVYGPNIEIRRHDITRDDLETEYYDLVHCRTVLMWLREPEKALFRMAEAVRPDGWLMIEENDYGSILSTDLTTPSAATFTSTWKAGIDFLRAKKIADPYFGRQVRNLLEHLGFVNVTQEGWTQICRGGGPMARFDMAAAHMAAKPMMDAGLLEQDKFESIQRLLMDQTFYYPGLTMFSAWGRRPMKQ